ncbi:hypothetical protein MPH_04215 [Macrophomina phaseolina MS6]|uniref:Uncharacterized protein n=1 Tax=Macrophomina phaseolina (strain MS6) TaxID=1126212 RepID=K2RUD4_MACPH|nr:hypothetical protein MPH_04215 [Macrophomina phaseolina MS6]
MMSLNSSSSSKAEKTLWIIPIEAFGALWSRASKVLNASASSVQLSDHAHGIRRNQWLLTMVRWCCSAQDQVRHLFWIGDRILHSRRLVQHPSMKHGHTPAEQDIPQNYPLQSRSSRPQQNAV